MGAREDLLAIPDEVLRSGQVAQAVLVHMDFRDTPKRWWTGFGDLDHAGHLWQGTGAFVSVSEISSAYDLSAQQVTFEIAATAEMQQLALAAKSRVRDRRVTVYLQLFATTGLQSDDGAIVAGHPIGSPVSLFNGTMQRMPWAAEGPDQRTLRIEAEGLFFRRNAPPRGRWTDADQRARYPGDKGFERLPLYQNGYEFKWRG